MLKSAGMLIVAGVMAALISANVAGQDKAAYERRSIDRYVTLFNSLDGNRDDAVSLLEAHGNVNFTADFDEIDINRNGIVTRSELDRFLTLRYGASSS